VGNVTPKVGMLARTKGGVRSGQYLRGKTAQFQLKDLDRYLDLAQPLPPSESVLFQESILFQAIGNALSLERSPRHLPLVQYGVSLEKGLASGSEGVSQRVEVVCLSVDVLDLRPEGEDPDLYLRRNVRGHLQEVSSRSLLPDGGGQADRDHDVVGEDHILEGDLQFADLFDEAVHPGTDAEVRRGITVGIDEEVRDDFVGDQGALSGGDGQGASPGLHVARPDVREPDLALALRNVHE
jgi:hypothetical protein